MGLAIVHTDAYIITEKLEQHEDRALIINHLAQNNHLLQMSDDNDSALGLLAGVAGYPPNKEQMQALIRQTVSKTNPEGSKAAFIASWDVVWNQLVFILQFPIYKKCLLSRPLWDLKNGGSMVCFVSN
jgi:hypothetical protein